MKLNKDLRLRKVQNKNFIVAVNQLSKDFHGMVKLNDTAAFVFLLLKKNKSVEHIVDSIAKKYYISKEVALKDVENIIRQFEKAGFFND
ncbi:MAG: PqqD family protein [Clostridiales bacterium]|nr:PqqD family protein [Clostridiales bacterium]